MSRSYNSRRGTHLVRKAPSRVRHEDYDVKKRAEEARLLHKVIKLVDLEDAPVFPDDRYRPKNHHHWL